MNTQPKTDEQGYELEEQTSEHEAELKRIRETGERLDYKSAGATRKRK